MALVKLGRSTQLVFFVVFGVLTGQIYNIFVYKPLRKEMSFLKQEKLRIGDEIGLQQGGEGDLLRIQAQYEEQLKQLSEIEDAVKALEEKLPTRSDMARLLKQLTKELGELGAQFISLKPTVEKAEEGVPFDSMEIEMQFYADYEQVINYLKKLEAAAIFLNISKLDLVLDASVSKKPLVSIQFSTLLSDRVPEKVKEEEIKPVEAPASASSPFHPESKPYDNRLPGSHHLNMVVWKGGTPVALIDGKPLKEGALLENKKLIQIESDGVWFAEDGIKYYLGIEQ